MNNRLHYISAIIFLGVFLFFKILSFHSIIHICQGEDVVVENCIGCECQLQVNDVPFLYQPVVQDNDFYNPEFPVTSVFYLSPFISNDSAYHYSNKAPPLLA